MLYERPMRIETLALSWAEIVAQPGLPVTRDQGPDFLAVHFDPDVEIGVLRERAAAIGTGAVHGGTSCLGAMSAGGISNLADKTVGLFAIWDADGDYGTACAPFSDDPKAASADAALRALQAAGRPGEAPSMVWLSSSPGVEEAVLAGIESVVGRDVPIVGGSAADNDISGNWAVFDQAQQHSEGVVVSVLFPSTDTAISFQSGYAPTDRSAVVTRAKGRRIYELDGMPAVDVYNGWTDHCLGPRQKGPWQVLSSSTFSPLGRKVDAVSDVPYFLLVHPATAHPDGSIDVFADIVVGERLHLMTGSPDTLVARAGRVAQQSREELGTGCDIAGALVVYCAGCMLAVRGRMDEVAEGVDRGLLSAPFLGIFTFGEQGSVISGGSRHGNLMISCVTFAAS